MSLVLQSSGGGQITIQEPATASNFTQTLPAATGTVMVSGNQPAFSAYMSSNQSITSATFTKVQINTEEFDTNNNYDPTTNYRFTPTVAGYYQVSARTDNGPSTGGSQCAVFIYKNGSVFKAGVQFGLTAAQFVEGASVSCLVFCNGSTDYIEFYASVTATVAVLSSGVSNTYFQAVMVRGA
jgi:hypothetical protein